MRSPAAAGDDGQVSLLLVGFFLVGVLLVTVVVDASAAFLRRQELSALADGAAVAAADGVRTEQLYLQGVPDAMPLDPAAARAVAVDYLTSVGALRAYPGLVVRVGTTSDSVEVRLTGPLDLPLTVPGWSSRTTVASEATAVSVVG